MAFPCDERFQPAAASGQVLDRTIASAALCNFNMLKVRAMEPQRRNQSRIGIGIFSQLHSPLVCIPIKANPQIPHRTPRRSSADRPRQRCKQLGGRAVAPRMLEHAQIKSSESAQSDKRLCSSIVESAYTQRQVSDPGCVAANQLEDPLRIRLHGPVQLIHRSSPCPNGQIQVSADESQSRCKIPRIRCVDGIQQRLNDCQ